MNQSEERRRFVALTLAGVGTAVLGVGFAEAKQKEAEVTPSEDLMREHGVLRRIVLIYEDSARRLQENLPLHGEVLGTAANLVRKFVEDYHEHVEETQVFPRLMTAGKQTELVQVLRVQHRAGRVLTATILKNAKLASAGAQRQAVLSSIAAFIRMYRPHADREDTVLFPAFQSLFTPAEFDRLGERFEEEEHKLLGSSGGACASRAARKRTRHL